MATQVFDKDGVLSTPVLPLNKKSLMVDIRKVVKPPFKLIDKGRSFQIQVAYYSVSDRLRYVRELQELMIKLYPFTR